MNVLEFEAKAILREQGVAIPKGEVAFTPEAAALAAQTIGCPVVIKVQVPIGGRMKAGGIRFAESPQEAAAIAGELLGSTLRGFPVDCLLVEAKLEIAAEVFVALTYDAAARTPVVLASAEGGIEIESSGQIIRRSFSMLHPLSEYVAREAAAALGFSGTQFIELAALIHQLMTCFIGWDALLLELNPIILDRQGHWWVADARLELDDDALWRQSALRSKLPESVRVVNRRTTFEQRAIEIDSADHRGVAGRLVPLGGTLGLLIGGGGASLTVLDAVLNAGLQPANYCEIGGNPSVWKVKELTKLILSQPNVNRLAVIMNVVSNTRVDLMARGVIKGVLELGLDPSRAIAVFRVPGSWETEGQAILNHYGVRYVGREVSIDQAVELIGAG